MHRLDHTWRNERALLPISPHVIHSADRFAPVVRSFPRRKQGVPINSLAQVLEPRHFREFDYLIGMDENNVRNIKYAQPKNSRATGRSSSHFVSTRTDGVV